jgi:hypothetical protein
VYQHLYQSYSRERIVKKEKKKKKEKKRKKEEAYRKGPSPRTEAIFGIRQLRMKMQSNNNCLHTSDWQKLIFANARIN